jgi:dTDP-4-amino-4,6-dideoxygalactose transaminase
VHTEVGYNSRLDELQAAALRVLLPHLDEWTAARRSAAELYAASGLGEVVELPAETEGGESCWHLYVVRCGDRDALQGALASAGIGARPYYTVPLHRQPAMKPWAGAALPESERAAEECLALPMGPALGADQVDAVAAAATGALPARAG